MGQLFSISPFARKLRTTINVTTLNLNMLKFKTTPRTHIYNLAKHYLNHEQFNSSKYLNGLAWKLQYYFHQVRRAGVLQYLKHSYAKVLFLSIFQNLASKFPFIRNFYSFAIHVPISHFLISMDRTKQKTSFRSCITSNEKYFILRNEHYQFNLGNLLRFLSSQEDSEVGIPILAMKNSNKGYPIKELKYLKGYTT